METTMKVLFSKLVEHILFRQISSEIVKGNGCKIKAFMRQADVFKGRSESTVAGLEESYRWNNDHTVAGKHCHCSWTRARLAVTGFIWHCIQTHRPFTCSDSRFPKWAEWDSPQSIHPCWSSCNAFWQHNEAKRIVSGFLQENKLFTKCTKY